jgi:hypothetical protein
LADKWIEVNIHLNGYLRTNEVLAGTVKKLVDDFKKENWIKSWHFFREPQIRLRFFGDENNIVKIKEVIDNKLKEMESTKGELYSCHVFGSHGRRDEEYAGEADYWHDDWSLVMKLWENTSEFALNLITKGPSKSLDIHGERHIHLLLNQLGLPHDYFNTGKEIIIQYRRPKRPNE